MSNFLSRSGLKRIDPKEFNLSKYTSKSSKGYVLENRKELRESHYDYLLVPNKIEIKGEILSEYQLKIDDLYNIPIGNVKKLVPNFFNKEKCLIRYENWELCLRLGLKLHHTKK